MSLTDLSRSGRGSLYYRCISAQLQYFIIYELANHLSPVYGSALASVMLLPSFSLSSAVESRPDRCSAIHPEESKRCLETATVSINHARLPPHGAGFDRHEIKREGSTLSRCLLQTVHPRMVWRFGGISTS